MSGVEVLRTERLVLRHLTEADAPFILELLNERGFIENIGDRGVRDLDAARRYVSEGPGASYQKYGYGLWLTLLKETGEPIGICGLVKREGLEDADVGYAFLERTWGRGYAQEAAAATLAHAREVIGLEKVVAITTPANAGSIAVLKKIGMKAAGLIQLPGHTDESAYFTT
ncbi:MAG: family N-acetyltransferase [Phenylobacterium sp.]|nr:family N-acetyltransferase [Phenylobacterium sp.]